MTILRTIKYKFGQLFGGTFFRNVALVASGTAVSQAIIIAFSPAVTRLYGPEAFGLLGAFTAAASVISPMAALAYPVAIVLPKDDEEARHICYFSLMLAIGFALMVWFLNLLIGGWLINNFELQQYSVFINLLPLVVIFSAWLQINQQWLIRKKEFKFTSKIGVLQSTLINGSKVAIGAFKPLSLVLVLLYTFGIGLHAFMLALGNNYNKSFKIQFKGFHIKNFKMIALKYYDFPVYRAPQMFLNSISQGLPILVLTSCFGPVTAGYFAISKNVLNMPTLLLGKSVSDVFYPKISDAIHNNQKIFPLLKKSTFALIFISFIPFLIIIIFGPFLFSFIFGKEWFVAGEYARWISVWSFFVLVTRPTVTAIPVFHLQGVFLFYEIFGLIIRSLCLYLGYLLFSSDLYAVAFFSIGNSILYTILLIAIMFYAKNVDKKLFIAGQVKKDIIPTVNGCPNFSKGSKVL